MISQNFLYIGTINKIDDYNRMSFSITISNIIKDIENLESINPQLQSGVIVDFDNFESNNPIILEIVNEMFDYIHYNSLYNDWMNDFTSISLYLVYKGKEVI